MRLQKKMSQEFLTLLHCWKFALRSVWAKINHLCKHSPKQKLYLQFSSGSMLFMCMLHILFTFTVFLYFSFHSTAHKTLISKTICCMLYGVSWLSLQYRFISLQLFYKQEKDAQAHSHDSSSLHSLHFRVFFYFLTLHHLWRFCIHVAMKPCFVFGIHLFSQRKLLVNVFQMNQVKATKWHFSIYLFKGSDLHRAFG